MARTRVTRRELRQQRKAAWALFERSRLRQWIVLVVAAKVAAIVLFFDTAGLDAFDLPKSLVSRVFAAALVGLLATAVLRYGHEIVPRTRLHLAVAAVAVAWLASAAAAENTYVAVFGERDRYLGLTFLADMLVLYAAVAVAFRASRDWETLLVGAGAATAASLAYGGVQALGLDWNKWQLDTQGRPFSTFGHPDMFGQYLSVAFAAAIGAAVAAAPRDGARRVAATVAALLILAGMAVVATRASALGVAAAVVLAGALAIRLRRVARPDARTLALGAIVVVALAAVALVSPLGSRLRATASGYAVQDRVAIYENAVAAIRDRPVLGWGPDAFAVAYPRYQQPREIGLRGIDSFSTSAHDWPLQAAVTTGIVGLAALLALVAGAVVLLWRRSLERAPAVAAPLLVTAVAYWASGLVSPNALAVDWIPWTVFGGAAALGGTRVPEKEGRRRFAVPGYVLASAATVVGLVLVYPPFAADREALQAQLSLSAGNAAQALPRAEAAVGSDGGRARYWSILGAADQLAQRWRAAADAHGESARRAPYVANYWVNVARSRAGQAASGDDKANAVAAALAAAQRAVETSPYEPTPHVTRAQIASELAGQHALAFEEMTRAVALDRTEPQYDKTAATIATQSPDARAALAFLQGLLAYRDGAGLRAGIAQTALRAGDRDVARDNARKALELDPANADARNVLASLGG